jgi:hypothetical protein
MSSRITLLKQTLLTEAATMKKPAYNFDTAKSLCVIRHPDEINEFPEHGIYLGERIWKPINTTRTVFNVDIKTYVQGVVEYGTSTDDNQSEENEAIDLYTGDLALFYSSIMSKYINDATNKWNISFDNGPLKFSPPVIGVGEGKNKAAVICEFHILLHNVKGITG